MSQAGLAVTNKDSCGHHADLRNIPTVQLGERLSSLYISEQQIPARQGEPSGNNPNNIHYRDSNPTDSSSTAVDRDGDDVYLGQGKDWPRRHLESSSTLVDTPGSAASPGSQAASLTPSTPPTISSGKSYSNEMHDELTPLREALPPAISTKRRSIADSGGSNRRNVNASSSYADYQTVPMPPRHSPTNIAGLSEMLASPHYETQAFRSPDYSPYERSSSGSRMMTTGRVDGDRQVDYFNLPISRQEEATSSHGAGPDSLYSPTPQSTSTIPDQQPSVSSDPTAEGGTSTPSWSSSDVTSGTHTSSLPLRSPKIRNEGMLAPHGSFTSASGRQYQARAKLERAQSRRDRDHDNESVKSGDSISSWRSRTASVRSDSGAGKGNEWTEDEYLQNVDAARGGDQLALYHLGWGPSQGQSRHSLGDADLVWGGTNEPTSPSSFSSRSSATSRPSARSNSTSGSFPRHLPGKSDQERLRDALHREPKKEERPKFHTRNSSTSDLFADVARMTLRSNASNNRTTTPAVETPKPRPPPTGAPASPGRPSIFKSASYVSSSGMSNGSGAGRSKKDKERRAKDKDKVKDEDGIRERDPDREKRRAARHAARKEAASASASGSNTTTTATAQAKRNANIDAVSASPITIPGRNADIEEEGQETPRPVGRSRSPTK